MPRPSFDNEVSHSPQVDNEQLYTDFKREFLDSLKQIDQRGLIEHEKTFLNSLETLTILLDKNKKPSYEDLLKIYHKVFNTLQREKFSPVIEKLKDILQKYIPFSEVPREKTEVSKELILSNWKSEIKKLTESSLKECSTLFPSSFSSETRWVKQIQNEIFIRFQAITPQNFKQKKVVFKEWLAEKFFSIPEQSQAYKLLKNIEQFLQSFENGSFEQSLADAQPLRATEKNEIRKETLLNSVETRRKLEKILNQVEVIRSKQLSSPPELRVHFYLRSRVETITEQNCKEVLLMLQKFLLPLKAKANSENFKHLRTEFLETLENILNPKAVPTETPVVEKPVTGPVPLDFDSLVNQPVVSVEPKIFQENEDVAPKPHASEPELPQAQIEVPPPTNLPLEESSVPPTEDTVLRTVDGEITFDPAAIQAESSLPSEESLELEPFTPIGEPPEWEAHHVTPGTQILPVLVQPRHSAPVERPTRPFELQDLARLRRQMNGRPNPLATAESEAISPEHTDEESMDFDLSDIDFGSLSPRENVHERFIEAGLATFTGKLDENRQYHDPNGKLVITKGMKDENGRKLPDYEYTVEGNFEHGKIVGEAHVTYAAETGGPLEITGPVDEDFKPHGKCIGANLNKSIEFVGEFIHGTPFEGEFYQFLSEKNNSEKSLLLRGVHYATTNLEPVNELGEYFFTPNGKRLLDDNGNHLPNVSDPRTDDSGPHSLTPRNIENLPPLEEEGDETPFGGEEFTMFGGQSLKDFSDESVEHLHEKPLHEESGEKEFTFTLRDGSPATYRGKFDDAQNPHDGDGLILIDGKNSRSVKIPYENGIPLREEAMVHFSPSPHVEATLVGPVDLNFLPDGKVKGQIHTEGRIYYFEGEVSHGIAEFGFVHCSDPEMSYFGPVTRDFLPDDENVISAFGITPMSEADETVDLPAKETLETNPLPKLNLDTSERFRHTIEKSLLSLPLNTHFASAEQSILSSFQNLCSQYKENKNGLLQALSKYLPEVHTYIHSFRLDADGEENFSQEFRDSVDTLQKMYDTLITQKTGEFNFGDNLHLTEKYQRDQAANQSYQFENAKQILKNEFHKKYPEIDIESFYREISKIEDLVIDDIPEIERKNMPLGLLSIITHSISREDFIFGTKTLLEDKVEKNEIETFCKKVADYLYGEEIEEVPLSQPTEKPPQVELNPSQNIESTSPEVTQGELPELSRDIRILRTHIRDLISDTLETKSLSKQEHDAILKDFSLSLRRNDFKDLTDFVSTLSKGQAKLDQMKEHATPTFRAFCGNLDAIILSALQTTKPSETPIPDSSETDTDTNEIHIPPESNEADDDDEGDLVDPTDNFFEEAPLAIQTPQGATTVETHRPLKESDPRLPSIITEDPSFEALSPRLYQEKLKENVQKLVETGKLSESLSHAITEEFYTLFDLNSPFTAQAISEKIALLRAKVLQRLSSTTDFQQIRAAFETPEPLIIWPWQREEKQKKLLRNNPDAKLVYALWKLTISVNELAE